MSKRLVKVKCKQCAGRGYHPKLFGVKNAPVCITCGGTGTVDEWK